MKKAMICAVSAVILTGCAGSANHEVLSANQLGDEQLSCSQIDADIVRAQVVIDGVNKDKDDLNGADVIDGLLWFPFNLIAKSGNYTNAVDAADSRIGKLQAIKQQKNCAQMSDNQKTVAADEITKKLVELSTLHKSGQLDDAEYRAAKRQVLGL